MQQRNSLLAGAAALVLASGVMACAPLYSRPPQSLTHGATTLARSPLPTQPGELPVLPTVRRDPAARLARTGGGPQDVETFTRRVTVRVAQLESTVRAEIDRGVLSRDALDEFVAGRGTIEALVRHAVRDGVVTQDETEQVASSLAELEVATHQYEPIPNAWPGGARYWR